MSPLHTDRQYEAELNHIRKQITTMSHKVEQMIESSIHAFLTGDVDQAYHIIHQDDDIDRLEVEIDQFCLNSIAKRQPVGPDLRFITTALKSVTDLERIADLCVNTAERTVELSQSRAIPIAIDLKPMANTVKSIVHDVIESFLTGDLEKARTIEWQDRVVDAYYAQLLRQLLEWMRHDAKVITHATRIQTVVNNLERIGDHAKNIAEKVIYLVTGHDVRHKSHRQPHASPLPRGILFLCVQNSARSQMAEGLARKLLPADIGIYSAGSSPAENVQPMAVEVMQELGIDISQQQPKRIIDVPLGKIDMIITLCSEEICVNLPGVVKRDAWLLPDPAVIENQDTSKAQFRQVRDKIRDQLGTLISQLESSATE